MKKQCYGYKVCYQEQGNPNFIRHFMTYTYKQALQVKNSYIRYPPKAREDNHKLINPTWEIIPISRSEVEAGIWREVPF